MGNYYEVVEGYTGPQVTKYYYAGAQRIAMRQGTALYYLFSDHLGSTSLTTDASGHMLSELRYTAWGQVRYNAGVTPTDYTYTGQYSNVPDFGLMYYGARWYDVSLGRFAQADMVVPSGVQGYDRYAFVYNNPLKYIDPSGHNPCSGAVSGYKCHREIDRARAWDQAHQSDDPIRHTLYLGGFTLTSATEELDQDEETQQITNRWQWIIEFIALIKEIGEGFQPMPNRGPNVKIYLSYDQFENGSLDNFSISVKNRSEGVVYVANVKFSINSADYSPCAKCGDFFVRPTQSDYLSTIKAGQTNNIDLCSNCLASPGMVDFR